MINGDRKGYWLNRDPKDVAEKLCAYRSRNQYQFWNPLYAAWVRNTYAYYSNILESADTFTSLLFDGDQGELVRMMVPQARTLARQLLTLTTKQKLAFKALASRDDVAVIQDMRIADAISEELCYEEALDRKSSTMVERGLVVGTSFIRVGYRTDRGDPIAADPNRNILYYRGKLEVTNPHISDMIYNVSQDEWDQQEWVDCRVRRNRYALIEQHPELEAEIMKLPSVHQANMARGYLTVDENDEVYCYELFVIDTPGCNGGRMMYYASPTCVFWDDYNKVGGIPIEQYKPEPIEGIGYGYPMLSSLLPCQEMYDHELSALATNHAAYGIHNVAAPRGAGIEVQELHGLNLLSYTPLPGVQGGGKPEKLDLMMAGGEQMAFAEKLLQNMQGMANINSALRGDMAASASGVAIATLTTNALEFLSAYGSENVRVMEKVMHHAVRVLEAFGPEQMTVQYSLKLNRSIARVYQKEALKGIKGYRMQAVNPLMQTMAGRLEVGKMALEEKVITSMQDYVSILDGQPLSTLFESEQSESDLIAMENEMLLQGKPCHALASDRHPKHVYGHKKLLNDPRVRANQPLVQEIENHLADHLQQAKLNDPLFAAFCATGEMPPMDPNAPEGPPGPPPGGPGGPGGAPGEEGPQQPGDGGGPPEIADPESVHQPKLKALGGIAQQGYEPEAKSASPAKDLLGRR